MKRRLTFGIGCVAAGAFTAVLVAWGCALWTAPDLNRNVLGEQARPKHGDYWRVFVWSRPGVEFVLSSTRGTPFPPDDGPPLPPASDVVPSWANLRPEDDDLSRMLDGRGWPMIALWCEYPAEEATSGAASRARGGVHIGGEPWSLGAARFERALPLRLAFTGLVVDSVLYSAGWGGVSLAFLALVRMSKRKRGRGETASVEGPATSD